MPALAEWYVELSAKGAKEAKAAIDEINKELEEGERNAEKFRASAGRAFNVVLATMTAMVAKGLQNTEEGDRLAAAFDRVAVAVTNALLPVIEGITIALEFVADAFESMGLAGQTAFLLIAAAAAMLMAVLTGGIAPILTAIGLGVAGIVTMVKGASGDTEPNQVTKKKEKEKEGRRMSFESGEEVFSRIQGSIAGGNVLDKQLGVLKEISANTSGTEKGVKRARPAVA